MSALTPLDSRKIERCPLLAALPDGLRDSILASSKVLVVRRGTTVFQEGNPARALAIVLEGWVKLYRLTPGGAEIVLNCFTEGQSFAEAPVLLGQCYPVSAEAATDARLLEISGRSLNEQLLGRPDAMRSVLAATYQHFHALISQIETLKARSGTQRVATFLLDLCPVTRGPCQVALPHEKSLIASRLGIRPASLSRAFARLGALGVAVHSGTAHIDEVQRLRDYADRDTAGRPGT